MTKTFFVTTPIYYMNGHPHLGHYYATTVADTLARIFAQKQTSFFLTGTDEHGEKVAKKAQERGYTPQEFTDKLAEEWRDTWQKMDIDYNYFIRTTDEHHKQFAQYIIQNLKDRGALYEQEYQALYCIGAESFVSKSELREGGLCPDHDETPQVIDERNWFFSLSDYKASIRNLIETDGIKITPQSRKNEVLEMLDNPEVTDFSVTRERVSWGIPVPFDTDQTIYVWIDALFNYLSAVVAHYDVPFQGRDITDVLADIEHVWPPDVHILGKDIVKFHAIYWPAFLLALGVSEDNLPRELLVTGMFLSQGRKMSKSLGNMVFPQDIIEFFNQETQTQRGNDILRYYVLREMRLGNDGDITQERVEEVYQSELVNKVGNTFHRVVGMARKYELMDARIPDQKAQRLQEKIDTELDRRIEKYDVYEALAYLLHLCQEIGQGIETAKPWEMKKQGNIQELERQVGQWMTLLEILAHAFAPYLPDSSQVMKELVQGADVRLFPRI